MSFFTRAFIFAFIFVFNTITFAQNTNLNLLKLPPGFSIQIYAEHIPKARQMALGAKNTVFVGSFSGSVYAIIPDPKSTHGTRVLTIASGLNVPNGVAFHDGALYVAEIDRILRYDHIEEHLTDPPKPVVITSTLPKERDHGWRFIRFGPEGKLYIGIGMPCDVCLPEDPRFGTIMRMDADGEHQEIFAKGIRNTVGFDWDPHTNKLWFTDNGRDNLGDDIPPDKLNVAPKAGLHFGFPYYNGKNLPDPTFGKLHPYVNFTPPTLALPAHVAAIGISFYTGNHFPTDYHNQIFLAEHGSWNRSKKVGYQVISVKVANETILSVKPFITGWLQGQKEWGRPVATLTMPDGTLLISDDFAGVVYRVTYQRVHAKKA